MKLLLTRLGLWIARWGYWPSQDVMDRAHSLCLEWESQGGSGEYKHHQVYARLIKDFPEVSRRTLGLAIELVLNT